MREFEEFIFRFKNRGLESPTDKTYFRVFRLCMDTLKPFYNQNELKRFTMFGYFKDKK